MSLPEWVQQVAPWVVGAGGLGSGGGLVFYGLARRERKADIAEKIQRAAGQLVDDLVAQVADLRKVVQEQAVQIAELRGEVHVLHDYSLAANVWQTQAVATAAAHNVTLEPPPDRPPTRGRR